MHDVGGHRRAVHVDVVVHGAHGGNGKSAGAGIHGLRNECLHVCDFGTHGTPRLCRVHAHDVDHERIERQEHHHVDRFWRAPQRLQEFRKGFPVPGQGVSQLCSRDLLRGLHHLHGALAICGFARRKSESAIAHRDRRDAVLPRVRTGGIPEQLAVIVRVRVDEPGGDDQALGVDPPFGMGARKLADARDPPVADTQIGLEPGNPVPSMIVPLARIRSKRSIGGSPRALIWHVAHISCLVPNLVRTDPLVKRAARSRGRGADMAGVGQQALDG